MVRGMWALSAVPIVHGKWIQIREYLREIAAKIESILWGKTKAWGLSIHEEQSTKISYYSPFKLSLTEPSILCDIITQYHKE